MNDNTQRHLLPSAQENTMAGNKEGAIKAAARRIGVSLDEYRRHTDADEKWCTLCKTWHHRRVFSVDLSRYDGLTAACATARDALSRSKYVKTGRRPRRGIALASARNGDKKQARARVNHRVDVGMMPDPNSLTCVDCGHVHVEGERRHEYDHHLGYSSEHQFDVEAVCTSCHTKRGMARGERRSRTTEKAT